jgi:hypothetical protein
MQTLKFLLVLSAGLVGCDSAKPFVGASAEVSCSKFNGDFFRKNLRAQISLFESSSVSEQYEIYLCGVQRREPPHLHLASSFAKGGKPVAEFLKRKLHSESSDINIRDILYVFSEMSRNGIYDARSDRELVSEMIDATERVKDSHWRKVCLNTLREIGIQH